MKVTARIVVVGLVRVLLPPVVLLLIAAKVVGSARSLPVEQLKLPPGFRAEVYARVPKARSLCLGPEGVLFVGTRGDTVYAVLPPAAGDAPRVATVATGLEQPNGVAFRDGALYVGEISRVVRFDDVMRHLDARPEPVVVNGTFPKERWHGWKVIRFSPDGWLYVPVGAPCNSCIKPAPFASMLRMRPDGSGLEVFATGIRNTVGFDWRPGSGTLYFTDNGRDMLGDDAPPDELDRAPRPGLDFGFPYCHGGDIPDPDLGRQKPCSAFTPPVVKLQPHAAALGMRFYNGAQFPETYRGMVFIAEHGSWNRSGKVGYRLVTVRLDGDRAGPETPFAEGWLQRGKAWGRPVDVEVAPDGSLFVSDDEAGAIYRISYTQR